MKAISLWQPHATALAVGNKRIETRSWSTNYRGPIAIHAAKRKNLGELIHYGACWNWSGALHAAGYDKTARPSQWLHEMLPFGAIVATAEIVDVRPTESFTLGEIETPREPDCDHSNLYRWTERQMGDFGLGRYGWILDNIRALATPMPFKGRQGFFNVPDHLIEKGAA